MKLYTCIMLLDRYRLGEVLGRGGMGTVYRAHDAVLKRNVAVKLLSGSGLGTDGRARLLREAQTVANLRHSNIVVVYDAGEHEESPYIVMELVEGQTLYDKKPVSLEEIVGVAKQICGALEHAHQKGIVHRDLKPENVIIEPDGTVKLMDFGLARSVATRMTSEGTIMGTVHYMAPEQVTGEGLDGRTDLYALGVMLYEFTTGQLPFEADSPVAIITQHLNAPVVPPRAKREDLPPRLNDLIVTLLAKNPDDRPASGADLLEVLDDATLLDSQAVSGHEFFALDRIVRGRMVARHRELDSGRQLWNLAAGGKGQTALISGEPGVGKTRLMRELMTLAETSGGQTFIGQAYAESNAPYNAFAQIARAALNRIKGDSLEIPEPVLADLLQLAPDLSIKYPNVPPNPRLDPEIEQQRLLEHLVIFCKRLAEEKPLLLVLDDIHWADSGTLTTFRHLARHTRKYPVMLLGTYREVELQEARPFLEVLSDLQRERISTRLKLNRLDEDQTREMLAAIFQEGISPAFLESIYRETDGNPFFIEEICRALIESGELYFENGQWNRPDDMDEMTLPQGVQVAVESRITRLPEEVQETLRMAAILGREFDFEVLTEASDLGEDALIDAMETAEHAQMIEGQRGMVFAFVHALVPQAIQENTHILRRRKLHKRAAMAFEKIMPEKYEALAHHFAQAGDDEAALKYHSLAGTRALETYANQDAENHFQAALHLVVDETQKADLLAQLGMARKHQERGKEAIQTWQQAIEIYLIQNNSDKAGELYAEIGRAYQLMADVQRGLDILSEGVEVLKDVSESPGMAQLLSTTGRLYALQGDTGIGATYIERSLKMAKKVDRVDIEIDSLINLTLLEAAKSRPNQEQVVKQYIQAAELAESSELWRQAARAYNNLAAFFASKGDDLGRGVSYGERAFEFAEKAKLPSNILFALVQLAYGKMVVGDIQSAKALMAEYPERGGEPDNAFYTYRLGALDYHFGYLNEALEKLNESHHVFLETINLQYLCNNAVYLSLALIEKKKFSDLITILEAIKQPCKPGFNAPSHFYSLVEGIVHVHQGDLSAAHQRMDRILEALEDEPAPLLRPVYLTAVANLAAKEKKWELAWKRYRYAEENIEELHAFYQAVNLRDWGRAHLERDEDGDQLRAIELLQKTLEIFVTMGADGWVRMLEEELAGMVK